MRTAFSSRKTTSAEVTAAKWERGRTPITEPGRSSCLSKRVSCCFSTTCMLLKLFSVCEENRVPVEVVSRAMWPNWRPSVQRASLRMFLPHPECAPAVHWRSFCWALAQLLFLLIAQRSGSVLLSWWPCEPLSWFFHPFFDFFFIIIYTFISVKIFLQNSADFYSLNWPGLMSKTFLIIISNQVW